MGILTIVTVISIISLLLGEIGRYIFPSIGNAPLLISDICIGVTVTVWVIFRVRQKSLPQDKLLIPLSAFILVCVLSLAVNIPKLALEQIFIAGLYILRFSMYAGMYFVVKDISKEWQKKIMLLLFVVGQIIVGLGYIQFFLYPSLRNLYYLGWDEHLYRMFSVFLDPNFAGVFFVLVCLLSLYYFLMYVSQKNYMFSSLFGVLTVLDVCAIYLTYSRTAFIALLASSIVFLWLYGQKKLIVLVLLVIFASIFLFPKSFQTEGTNLLRVASTASRLKTAGEALQIYEKNPVLGVGFNAYRYAQIRYGYLKGEYELSSHGGSSTDNSFLFVLATTGTIGGLTYLYLLFSIGKACFVHKERNSLQIIVFVSWLGVVVSAFFNNTLFYIFILQWLWILLGISTNGAKKK